MPAYGSAAYGSASYGGGGGSNRTLFFLAEAPLAQGFQSRMAEYTGSKELYLVNIHMDSYDVVPIRQVKVYTHNNAGETPQLQATMGEAFESETSIGAARFITVEVQSTANLSSGGMLITGRELA